MLNEEKINMQLHLVDWADVSEEKADRKPSKELLGKMERWEADQKRVKQCSKCGIRKPIDEYYKRSGSDKRQGVCKDCYNEVHYLWCKNNPEKSNIRYRKRDRKLTPERKRETLLKAYGLTLVKYREMVDAQNGRCAICNQPAAKLQVDHCHKTGTVRGLLCMGCNTGIGLCREDPAVLRTAAEYLEKHAQKL